jgi:hypothetical protein
MLIFVLHEIAVYEQTDLLESDNSKASNLSILDTR